MTFELVVILLACVLAAPLSWLLPRNRAADGIAVWTLACLSFLAPYAAMWLVVATFSIPVLMRVGDRFGGKGLITTGWCIVLVGGLFFSRMTDSILWVGAAYFTLRLLHIQFEWWMGRLPRPTIADHLRYQLFLPVIMSGPINRYPAFHRQLIRRRWDAADFFSGAERALLGLAQATILGSWIMGKVETRIGAFANTDPGMIWQWALSAAEWTQLYLTLAGFSSFVIGVSLMMGIRIEENFDRPWQARNLIEFWSRWHMTLSSWCRDYVFQPVAALTRLPVLGVLAAMTAIGLWHDTTAYYLLWAAWQALGIVVSHVIIKAAWPGGNGNVLTITARFAGPAFVVAWLTATRPVVHMVLGVF